MGLKYASEPRLGCWGAGAGFSASGSGIAASQSGTALSRRSKVRAKTMPTWLSSSEAGGRRFSDSKTGEALGDGMVIRVSEDHAAEGRASSQLWSWREDAKSQMTCRFGAISPR